MGFWMRIRQNLSLKIISLITAILLYIYVQQERNPTIPRTLIAAVVYRNLPVGYQVVPEHMQIPIVVTGPRPSVERLKDSDIKAEVDLTGVSGSQPNLSVHVGYELPKSLTDVTVDSAPDIVKLQVYRQKTRKLAVKAIYHMDSPAGLKYGEPIIRPATVTVRGREDRVNRVDKVIATASPNEPRTSIDGDFSVQAWDSDNNVVEDVVCEPDRVHVTVPQVLEPSTKTVLVNAIFADRPAPPYMLANWIMSPNQVKVIGAPNRLAEITGISTETLSIKDITANTTLDASLIIPPDVEVRDLSGRLVTHVKVMLIIARAATSPPIDSTPPANNQTKPPPTAPPKRDGVTGQ